LGVRFLHCLPCLTDPQYISDPRCLHFATARPVQADPFGLCPATEVSPPEGTASAAHIQCPDSSAYWIRLRPPDHAGGTIRKPSCHQDHPGLDLSTASLSTRAMSPLCCARMLTCLVRLRSCGRWMYCHGAARSSAPELTKTRRQQTCWRPEQ
jgi:hypothetical protein